MEEEVEEVVEMRRIVFPAQHLGPITTQQAESQLREVAGGDILL